MARGFWNGILTGGIVGALVAMFVSPQMKPAQKRSLVKQGKRMQTRAQRVMKDVRGGVKNLKKILD